MRVIVILDLPATATSLDELRDLLSSQLATTRSWNGCHSVRVCADASDPHRVVAVEEWESQAHYAEYVAWRQSTGDAAKLVALLAAPPQVRVLQAGEL